MTTRSIPFLIRDPQGVNRRDGADRVSDNEFQTLQNCWHRVKGLLEKRPGTVADLSASDVPGAAAITGVYRHYNTGGEKITIYHCEPDTAVAFPDATTDLVLTEIAGGNLFNGGAVETMRISYSWVGRGAESQWNSINRVGWDATKTHAWLQPGHQTFVVSSNVKGIRVQVPAFPSGIRSANIYAARGVNTEMVYVGSIAVSNGTFDLLHYIAPAAANVDLAGTIFVDQTSDPSGTLLPGTYYISAVVLADSAVQDLQFPTSLGATGVKVSSSQPVQVYSGNNAITISSIGGLPTAHGASAVQIFIGRKDALDAPMVWVGNYFSGSMTILGFPDGLNAQTHTLLVPTASTDLAVFHNCATRVSSAGLQMGFVVKKNASGVIGEILPSRTLYLAAIDSGTTDPTTGVSSAGGYIYLGMPRTKRDGNFSVRTRGKSIYEPVFCNFFGLTFFVNGVDQPWQTDGYTLGQITRKFGTFLPRAPRFLCVYQNQLLSAGSEAGSVLYASNTEQHRDWSDSGGVNLRYTAIGDTFGDSITSIGVFGFTPEANNDPRAFFIVMKKHGCWIRDSFPTVGVTGGSLQQVSGRVGCTAPRSLAQTHVGLAFLGSDGVVYLQRGTGEPRRIGLKVKNLLEHLSGRDDLMEKCTAVFHNDHYKLSYPSSTASTYNDAQLWVDMRIEDGTPIIISGPHIGVSVGAQVCFVGEGDDFSRVAVRGDSLGTILLDQTSTYQDLGQPIVTVVKGKAYRFKAEMNYKRILSMFADLYYDTAYSHNALMEFFMDDQYASSSVILSSAGGVWDSNSYDASVYAGANYQGIPFMLGDSNLAGRLFTYQFTHSNNANLIIANFGILYSPERRTIV